MRIQTWDTGVKLWLSARDTEDWATRPGAVWPRSELRGRRLFVEYDRNGLFDLLIDSGRGEQDCPGHELDAMVSDHLAGKLPADHPCFCFFERATS
jgi:hypothetical protein